MPVNASTRRISKFDFRRSKRLTRQQRAGLQVIADSFSKSLTSYFTTLFRILVEVKYSTVTEMLFIDYISTRNNPSCIWTFSTKPGAGSAIVELELPFTFLIIDRLFSGEGLKPIRLRPLTAIEKSILQRVIERVLQMWDKCWLHLESVSSELKEFHHEPYLAQIAGRTEPIIVMQFTIVYREMKYELDFCFPFAAIDPLLNKMKGQNWVNLMSENKEKSDQSEILSTLMNIKNPLTIMLGKTKISFREFLNLEKSNVIVLQQNVNQPLVAKVGPKPSFLVKPGIIQSRRAVKIVKRFEEASDEWELNS